MRAARISGINNALKPRPRARPHAQTAGAAQRRRPGTGGVRGRRARERSSSSGTAKRRPPARALCILQNRGPGGTVRVPPAAGRVRRVADFREAGWVENVVREADERRRRRRRAAGHRRECPHHRPMPYATGWPARVLERRRAVDEAARPPGGAQAHAGRVERGVLEEGGTRSSSAPSSAPATPGRCRVQLMILSPLTHMRYCTAPSEVPLDHRLLVLGRGQQAERGGALGEVGPREYSYWTRAARPPATQNGKPARSYSTG